MLIRVCVKHIHQYLERWYFSPKPHFAYFEYFTHFEFSCCVLVVCVCYIALVVYIPGSSCELELNAI